MSRKEAPAYPLPHLKEWRQQRFMSQGALAVASGVSLATIKYLEAGKHPASAVTVAKLAKALGIAPTEMIAASNATADRREGQNAVRTDNA